MRRTVKFTPSVEDKIKDMVLIPGAGEFVYGTSITTKQDMRHITSIAGDSLIPIGDKQPINMHNYSGKPDVQVVLSTLPPVPWVVFSALTVP